MPTHYFTVTTDIAINLVSSKKHKEIEVLSRQMKNSKKIKI